MIIDQDKTLAQLNKEWDTSFHETPLVKSISFLRNKPLKQFTIEDLRLLIGQNCNLEIIIPLALDRLRENILAEGDYYEGDLLKNVF
jgi:hypothetical protein